MESKAAARALDRAPGDILERYELWLLVARLRGPQVLRRGFPAEDLREDQRGHHLVRLNDRLEVIYETRSDAIFVNVVRISSRNQRR